MLTATRSVWRAAGRSGLSRVVRWPECLWLYVALFHAGFLPKLAGHLQGLDTGLLPPGFLVLCPMDFPVVNPTERDCELVARLAAKRARLHKPQVVRVRRFPAT